VPIKISATNAGIEEMLLPVLPLFFLLFIATTTNYEFHYCHSVQTRFACTNADMSVKGATVRILEKATSPSRFLEC
jgi:hypothetical protein